MLSELSDNNSIGESAGFLAIRGLAWKVAGSWLRAALIAAEHRARRR